MFCLRECEEGGGGVHNIKLRRQTLGANVRTYRKEGGGGASPFYQPFIRHPGWGEGAPQGCEGGAAPLYPQFVCLLSTTIYFLPLSATCSDYCPEDEAPKLSELTHPYRSGKTYRKQQLSKPLMGVVKYIMNSKIYNRVNFTIEGNLYDTG